MCVCACVRECVRAWRACVCVIVPVILSFSFVSSRDGYPKNEIKL